MLCCWCSICRLVGLWVRLLSIPQPLLYGGILVFSTLGVYSLNNSTFDLVLLFIVGIIGFLMRRHEFPVAPCIIGLILGPLAEAQFRRALSISQGDPSVFVTHPLICRLAGTCGRSDYCSNYSQPLETCLKPLCPAMHLLHCSK